MLTVDKLKAMEPNERFAMGITTNSPEGVYMTDSNIGREMLWVAKRGYIHDWAIYIHWATTNPGRFEMGLELIPTTPEYVIQYGQKIIIKENIKKLVECSDEAFALYRFQAVFIFLKYEFVKISFRYGLPTFYTRKDGMLVIGSVDTNEKRAKEKFNEAVNNSCGDSLPINSVTDILETVEK